MNKKRDFCFVRAKLKDDYVFDAYLKMGYEAITSYRDHGLILRGIREMWYRLGLPHSFWYNPQLAGINAEKIIVGDLHDELSKLATE